MYKTEHGKFLDYLRNQRSRGDISIFITRVYQDDLDGADIGEVLYMKGLDKVAILQHAKQSESEYKFTTGWIDDKNA